MESVMAILTGIFYTAGIYMILRRSTLKFIIGIIFLSNATNLLVFLSAGLVSNAPPFTEGAGKGEGMADPLPQALVLTAIVIGLGLVAFTLALKYKFFEITGSDDLDEVKPTES